jgi:omega-amidase
MSHLRVSLVQTQLKWRLPEDNRAHIRGVLANHLEDTDLVVLPETFTTGFLGDGGVSEGMDGPTIEWMRALAAERSAAFAGSAVIEDGGRYNRLLWMEPNGRLRHYDKRHLFAHAGEDQRYDSGRERKIFAYRGWRVCPQICYDIRFPVWCRNRNDYDLMLVVANWPTPRVVAWRSLLQARAIENQCYVVAVNRVGQDGNDYDYPGNSLVFDPMGELVLELGSEEVVAQATLDLERVRDVRERLPFHREADAFELRD